MLCCGYAVFCKIKHEMIGVEIYLDENDRDTITGYSCDYCPNCYLTGCKLTRARPIGESVLEMSKKYG